MEPQYALTLIASSNEATICFNTFAPSRRRSTSEEFVHLFSADMNLHFYQKPCLEALATGCDVFHLERSKNMVLDQGFPN